jgi:hypothetical protein
VRLLIEAARVVVFQRRDSHVSQRPAVSFDEADGVFQVGNNWGTIAPEHQGRGGNRADQEARRVNKIDNPALSAKPPSPVQIRAAPPNFSKDFASPDRVGLRRARLADVCWAPDYRAMLWPQRFLVIFEYEELIP